MNIIYLLPVHASVCDRCLFNLHLYHSHLTVSAIRDRRMIRDFDNSLLFIIIYDATHTHALGVYSIKCQIELTAYVIILYDSDENAFKKKKRQKKKN